MSRAPAQKEVLQAIEREVESCKRCGVPCEQRTNAVPGEGDYDADVMVIGEAPGAQEDEQGRPFIGKSGQYLRNSLEDIFERSPDWFFITNVLKCRPPENRDPEPDEIRSCQPYLFAQISAINPKVMLGVGRFASGFLLNREGARMGDMRGKIVQSVDKLIVCTYHPGYVLRNRGGKGEQRFRQDLRLAKQAVETYGERIGS